MSGHLYDNRDSGLFCPVCESRIESYIPLDSYFIENAERYGFKYFISCEMTPVDTYSCPRCGASDRERLIAHWIRSVYYVEASSNNKKLLHIAPEKALSVMLKNNYNFDYKTADLFSENVDYNFDLTAIPLAEGTFDFIICSHVLEHIDNDAAALSELFRVLKRGGYAILLAPICCDIEDSIEDPSIKDPADRWRYYGQDDHVRLYSRKDFAARIAGAEFQLMQYNKEYYGNKLFKRLGLKDTSVLYVAGK